MAGAAQTIGWILTVDSSDVDDKLGAINTSVASMQESFSATVTDAIKPAVTALEDLRNYAEEIKLHAEEFIDTDNWDRITDAVDGLKTNTVEMKDAVTEVMAKSKETGVGTNSWWDKITGVVKFLTGFFGTVFITPVKFILGTVMKVFDFGFKFFGTLFFAVGALKTVIYPIFRLVRFLDKTISTIVFGTLKGAIKLATGMIVRMGKLLSKTLTAALGPVFTLAKWISVGLKRALGPVFQIFNEVMDTLFLALEPIFMAFRIMIIPFVYILFPIFVQLAIWLLEQIMDAFKWLWDNGLKDVWAWLTDVDAWKDWWRQMKVGWNIIWEGGLKDVWAWLTDWDGWARWWGEMKADWTELWETLGLKALWEFISSGDGIKGWWRNTVEGWEILKGAMVGAWNWWVESVHSVWNWLSGAVSGGWQFIKDGWNWISESMSTVFKKIGEWVMYPIKGIQWLLYKILYTAGGIIADIGESTSAHAVLGKKTARGLASMGWKLRDMGAKLYPGEAEALAEGGLVNQPTLAVVGEAGPELVIPLRRATVPEAGPATVTPLTDAGPGGGDVVNDFFSLVTNIRDILAEIADNTVDSSWVHDPDFNGQCARSSWEQ